MYIVVNVHPMYKKVKKKTKNFARDLGGQGVEVTEFQGLCSCIRATLQLTSSLGLESSATYPRNLSSDS